MNISVVIFSILGILSMLYGLCVFALRTGTFTFVLWIGIAVFFLGLAICSHLKVWSKLPKPLLGVLIIAFSIAVIFFTAVEGCIVSGFAANPPENLDYIIVLGAQVRADGPSRVLRYRLDAAYDYLMENDDTLCIVSGGKGPNEPTTEAEGMYEYLIKKGVPADRILIEDQSLDTPQNLINSSQYFDSNTANVGIVTNNFHLYRGVYLAKKLGIRNSHGIVADSTPFYLPNNMLREFFGVARDLFLK